MTLLVRLTILFRDNENVCRILDGLLTIYISRYTNNNKVVLSVVYNKAWRAMLALMLEENERFDGKSEFEIKSRNEIKMGFIV